MCEIKRFEEINKTNAIKSKINSYFVQKLVNLNIVLTFNIKEYKLSVLYNVTVEN